MAALQRRLVRSPGVTPAVVASGTSTVTDATMQPIVFTNNPIRIVRAAAILQASDASGKLTLQRLSVSFNYLDSNGNSLAAIVLPQDVSFHAGGGTSLPADPSAQCRVAFSGEPFDVQGSDIVAAASTQCQITSLATVLNTDGAAPHSFGLFVQLLFEQ